MDPFEQLLKLASELKEFFQELGSYLVIKLRLSFLRFEKGKGIFTRTLYIQRGKYARRLMHSSMALLTAVGIAIAPVIAQEFPGTSVDPWELNSTTSVLSAASVSTSTLISEKQRGEIIEYTVNDGDTIGIIAEKFGVSEETIMWQNNLSKTSKIKTGETLEILPVTGTAHTVKKGDTVYSIAKRYDVDPQEIVNFPFNTYVNDETFALAIGQSLVVPNGVQPEVVRSIPRARRLTPDAGTVVASGQFVWPTAGRITQNFVWYHKGLDIANRSAPNILAADSGTVIVAGWPDGFGYGNRVVIDHGNGYRTLYAHMSSISVRIGQSVVRGGVLGRMGSTGRSTGTHLHFEVIKNGVNLNPLSVLR